MEDIAKRSQQRESNKSLLDAAYESQTPKRSILEEAQRATLGKIGGRALTKIEKDALAKLKKKR